jgi:uncharacterized SAM-binding protein YcdF (DUF218 family)
VGLGAIANLILVPPVNLVLLATLAILAGRRRVAVGLLAALLLLAVPIVSLLLLRGLAPAEEAGAPTGPPQAIVVLGADTARHGVATIAGPLTRERLEGAASLARQTGLPVLVAGGITSPDTTALADAMAVALRDDYGEPARWVEDRSVDTMENATDSADILLPLGISRVLLVTHSWHMRRALLAFRAAGFVPIAAPLPDPPIGPLSVEQFVPLPAAWMRSFFALHEWVGLLWYTVRVRF